MLLALSGFMASSHAHSLSAILEVKSALVVCKNNILGPDHKLPLY